MLKAPWRAEVLGNAALICGEEVVDHFRDRTVMALIALIALRPEAYVPREQIRDILWPEDDPDVSRGRLRVLLHRLRAIVEPSGEERGRVLQTRGSEVALNPAALMCDATDFLAGLEAAQRSVEPSERLQKMERALSLYRGELLPGFYHEWALGERNRIAGLHFRALRRLSTDCMAVGAPERGVAFARQAVEREPLDEEASFDLMRLLGGIGRATEALREYDRLRETLGTELGEAPAAPTRHLAALLQKRLGHRVGEARDQTPELSNQALARPTARPEPVPRAANASVWRPLPARLTQFFGRSEELSTLRSLLSPTESTRLVTVLGPAGAGKTRLSLEIVESLQATYGGRCCFVPLADVTAPSMAPEALLLALGLSPAEGIDALTQALAALNEAPALLALDNMEHLLPEAKELVETMLQRAPTLRCLTTSRRIIGCEGERVYGLGPLPLPEDSREEGEMAESPAVVLFVDRARAVCSDFALARTNAADILMLCRRLEGIPLALELAAARARALTVREMCEQLGSSLDWLVDPRAAKETRHRSLRAAIEWSYQLMSPAARDCFHAVSVFVGGFTAAAAAAVCADRFRTTGEALAMLEALSCDSILYSREDAARHTRFAMLETLRAFALERLAATGREPTVRRRHLDWFTRSAEAVHREDADSLRARAEEDGNFRAALEFGLREGADQESRVLAARLARALPDHFIARGSLADGRALLERALDLDVDENIKAAVRLGAGKLALRQGDYASAARLAEEGLRGPPAAEDAWKRAGSLFLAGMTDFHLGDYRTASRRLEEALALTTPAEPKLRAERLAGLGLVRWYLADHATAQERLTEARETYLRLGSQQGAADCLLKLGNVVRDAGDLRAGEALLLAAREAFLALDDRQAMAIAEHDLGLIAQFSGETTLAEARLTQALAQYRAIGSKPGAASCLHSLAEVAVDSGRWKEGRASAVEALESFRGAGARRDSAACLLTLGRAAEGAGDLEEAADLMSRAVAIDREIENRQGLALDLNGLGRVRLAQGRVTQARVLLQEALDINARIGTRASISISLESHVRLFVAEGRLPEAARCAGIQDAVFAAMQSALPPVLQRSLEQAVNAARSQLSPEAFHAAWEEGRTMSDPAAIAAALRAAPAPS